MKTEKTTTESRNDGNTVLAEVAVYNEDCRQTMERLQSNSLDLIVTSPPYFNARDYS
jgi:DNA modification methylase